MIATEFKYHHFPCYGGFTRNIDNIKQSVQQYEKGGYVKVKKFIMENIVKGHQVVSLKEFHKMHNLGYGDRIYRFNYLLQSAIVLQVARHLGKNLLRNALLRTLQLVLWQKP